MTIFSIILFCLVMNPVISSEDSSSGSICGTVTDYFGNPLHGATVMLVGTNMGAMTDINGAFTISGITPGFIHSVQALMIGMDPSSIVVEVISGSRSMIHFKLEYSCVDETSIIIQI